jgi:hypothetical protein
MRLSDFSIDLWPMALGSAQPLTDMSTRNLPGEGVKSGRRVRLATSLPSESTVQ